MILGEEGLLTAHGAKHTDIISVASPNEALGMDEILIGLPTRMNSLIVNSERCQLLFMMKQDFIERVLQAHPETKRHLVRQL